MRRAAVVVAALSAPSALVACTLLTSLDGFTGAPDPRTDGAPETAPNESGSDAAPTADSGGGDVGPSSSDLYAVAVLADKPLGYWRLEETSGTIAKDETGRHDGVYVRSPILGQPGVAGGRAVKLPRSSQSHIHVASSALRFLGNAAHSIEVWVQPGDIKNYQWIGSTEIPQTTSSRSGWSVIGFANAAVNYEVWQPSQDGGGGGNVRALPLSPTPLTTGRLHHLVVTYDGSRVAGYFDGVNGNTRSASGAVQGGGDLYWGCQADVTSCLDDWLIDELAIYDSVLQPDRVKAHFDLGK